MCRETERFPGLSVTAIVPVSDITAIKIIQDKSYFFQIRNFFSKITILNTDFYILFDCDFMNFIEAE